MATHDLRTGCRDKFSQHRLTPMQFVVWQPPQWISPQGGAYFVFRVGPLSVLDCQCVCGDMVEPHVLGSRGRHSLRNS